MLWWTCTYISVYVPFHQVIGRQCPLTAPYALCSAPGHALTPPTCFTTKGKGSLQKTGFVYRSYDLRDTHNSLPTFLTHDLFIWSSWFSNYTFLIYHNLKCFKSIANSDTTVGNIFQGNICTDSYSFPSDTKRFMQFSNNRTAKINGWRASRFLCHIIYNVLVQ